MFEETLKIKINENGSLLIKGGATLVYPDGSEVVYEKTIALCRCGLSEKKPFCDGNHKKHQNLKILTQLIIGPTTPSGPVYQHERTLVVLPSYQA